MNRYISIISTILITIFLYFGCGNNYDIKNPLDTEYKKTTSLKINIKYAPRIIPTDDVTVAKSTAIEAIDRVTIYIYDTPWTTYGTPVITENLAISNKDIASGIIEIPIVNGETSRVVDIHVVFYGEDDPQNPNVRYFGEETLEIIFNETNTISINAVYMGVDTQIDNGTAFVDYWDCYVYDTINIVWNDVASGLSNLISLYNWTYILEESANDVIFVTQNIIYNGPNVNYTINDGQLYDGIYYYRTCVNTIYGYGPWFSTGVATVAAAPLKSTIEFDMPLPGDEPQ